MKNLIFVMLLIGTVSCASFKNSYVKDKATVNPDQLTSLNGSYSLTTDFNYNEKGVLVPTTVPHPQLNLYSVITGKPFKMDSTINYYAKVSFEKAVIHFDLYKGTEKFESFDMIAKLKKDGLFYLANTKIEIEGVPYLYGRTSHSKMRLGINKNGDLMVNFANGDYGAVLFIIGDGHSYNSCHVFKAVK